MAPFSVVRKDFELVKPSKPTPSEVLSFSTIDNDVNMETISPTIFVCQSTSDSSNKTDPANMIKQTLSETLVHYYPLAGRLKRHSHDGRLRLTCNTNGVPFLEATADCTLSSLSYLDDLNFDIAKEFVSTSSPFVDEETGYAPLIMQVTKFSCGGFTIGFGLSHSVSDGFGAAQFFQTIAELSKGKELSVKPVWERERLVGSPIKEPIKLENGSPAKSPYLPFSDVVDECFYVKSESIKRLKESLAKEKKSASSLTTFEVLAAYVWRARLRALKLNHDGITTLFFATGLRRVINPPLPEGYYGNAFLTSAVEITGKELDEKPLSEIASLIKEKKKDVYDNNYIRKSIDLLETELVTRQNEKIKATGALMAVTDWRNLGLVVEEIGFEWKVVNVTTLQWECFGSVDLCTFLPPPKSDPSMKDAVGILVSLPRPAMVKFKEEMNTLMIN
ncbi:spermidine coumaroyl-CoA acyltransferase-like [Humulus lupulus]|uniref:spermidine coumaroyl-CoA acyltransferase-like n=1 Tax=Humulus lupulus TaxID=3486 RepID=UPI002B406813|nr:spermidine coumaroyl-CoA acyltransferase-like [Humulus lupulus]